MQLYKRFELLPPAPLSKTLADFLASDFIVYVLQVLDAPFYILMSILSKSPVYYYHASEDYSHCQYNDLEVVLSIAMDKFDPTSIQDDMIDALQVTLSWVS